MSGSGFTPMAASYQPSDWHLTAGASFRMVLDVGNWDASRFINTPGQSGDPQSPHYRDLAPLWLAGQYVPLAYSRAADQRDAVTRIRLEPGADAFFEKACICGCHAAGGPPTTTWRTQQ